MYHGLSWEDAITLFFRDVEPTYAAYKSANVSFLGRRIGPAEAISILRMSVVLQPLSVPVETRLFSSGEIVAGTFMVTEAIDSFLRRLMTAEPYELEIGTLLFAPMEGGYHSMASFEQNALDSGARLPVVTFTGYGSADIPQPGTDWALRAHDTPYSDINDLAADFGFGQILAGAAPVVEVRAYHVGVIDAESAIDGEQATVGVRLAKGLDTSKVKIGIKVMSDGGKVERVLLKGGGMSWGVAPENEEISVAKGHMTVPQNALLHCYLSYGDQAIHSYWVQSPRSIPNAPRQVLESFDEGLEKVRKGLSSVSLTKQNQDVSGDFEHSCAAILWMLGFSVFRPVRKAMGNAVDILARSPRGHFLLVECTTGPFKADKRANLLQRSVEVKASLARSWQGRARVIPVMVTSAAREATGQTVTDLAREGIAAFTREDLVAMVDGRTLFLQDADRFIDELETQFENLRSAAK